MPRPARALLSVGLLTASLAAVPHAGAAARAGRAPGPCPGTGPICCGPVTGGPNVIPCCEPVAAGPRALPCCEPTIVPCTGSLTISATPDPSKPRREVKITGQLLAPAGSAAATITLWQELSGQSTFHQLAQTTTDAAGHYSFTRPAGTVQTNRSWYVRSASAQSATVSQRVWDAITLAANAKRSGNGELVTFGGRVTPSHSGAWIRLERRSGKAWILIASVRLTTSSSYRLREQFAGASTIVVRAAIAGDRRNIKTYSAAVKTTL